MNSIADIESYDNFDFHFMNYYEQKRPMFLTTQNSIYALVQNEKGSKEIFYTPSGKPAPSPRLDSHWISSYDSIWYYKLSNKHRFIALWPSIL